MDNSSQKFSQSEAQRLFHTLSTLVLAQLEIAASRSATARDRARAMRRLERALAILEGRKKAAG